MLLLPFKSLFVGYLYLLPGVVSFLLLFINFLTFTKTPLVKNLSTTKKQQQQNSSCLYPPYLYTQFLFIVTFIFSKKNYNNTINYTPYLAFTALIVVFVLYYLTVFSSANTRTMNYSVYIPGFFFSCFLSITSCSNLIEVFLLMEVIAYLLYLQFLQQDLLYVKKQCKSPVMDGVLLYFLGNFLGSIFFFIGIYLILQKYNTTSFVELVYFLNKADLPTAYLFFIIIGLYIKIGVFGVQTLKVEIYRNLKLDSVLNFSFLSILFYLMLLTYLYTNLLIYFSYAYVFLLLILITFGSTILYSELLKLDNIVSFFGYSTMLTVTLLALAVI